MTATSDGPDNRFTNDKDSKPQVVAYVAVIIIIIIIIIIL